MTNPPKIGDIVADKFEIQEILGSGGIGTVYRAYQQENQRTVALKILHESAAADEEYRARFLQEARALSKLHHANVVTVYHLGISEHGMYLAMEYLKGSSVRTVLNSIDCLPAYRAFKIVRDAARALAFVHEQNIVHRDLKPENIMIVEEPGPDTVKLVDFGLARIIDAKSQKLTRTGMLMGTSSYMSPEQCMGKSVDFRSDIYSLTLCLYEMLTGEKPFDADTAVGLMYKHINEAPPSIKGALASRFPGVNKLIAKGLAKDPLLRFANMNDLADEIDLMFSLAAPEDLVSVKPAQLASGGRRWLLITSVSLVTISFVVLGLFLVVFQPFDKKAHMASSSPAQLAQEKIELELKRSIALKERRYGKKSMQVVDELIVLSDRMRDSKKDVAIAALMRAADIEETSDLKSPVLIMRLMNTAVLFRRIGDSSKAETLARRALEIADKNDVSGAVVKEDLDLIIDCDLSMHKKPAAIPYLLRVVSLVKSDPNARSAELATYYAHLGLCYEEEGKKKETESCYKDAIAAARVDPASSQLDENCFRLGELYERQERFAEAEPLMREILQIAETKNYSNYSLPDALEILARCCMLEGKLNEAESLFKRALSSANKPTRAVAEKWELRNSLAACYLAQGKSASVVEAELKQALDIAEQNKDKAEQCLSRQVSFCRDNGKFQYAELLIRHQLALHKQMKTVKDDELAADLAQLADCCCNQGKFTEAQQICMQAIALKEKHDPKSSMLVSYLHALATYYVYQSNYSGAERILRRAIAVAPRKTSPLSESMVQAVCLLSTCCRMQNRIAEAEAILNSYISAQDNAMTSTPHLVAFLADLARCSEDAYKAKDAENILRRIVSIEEGKAPGSAELANAYVSLGNFFQSRYKFREAEPFYQHALAISLKIPESSPALLDRIEVLSKCYHEQRKYKEQEALNKQAIGICENLPAESGTLADCLMKLANIRQEQSGLTECEALRKRAIAIGKKLMPGGLHVVSYLHQLAQFYAVMGRNSEAEPLFREVLSLKENARSNIRYISTSLMHLVECCLQQGKYKEAEQLTLRAYEIGEKLDPASKNTECLFKLTYLCEKQERQKDAERLYKQAISQCETRFPNNNEWLIEALLNFADYCNRRHRYEDVDRLCKQALPSLESQKLRLQDKFSFMGRVANTYNWAGRTAEAEEILLSKMASEEKLNAPKNSDHFVLANYEITLGRPQEALVKLKQSCVSRTEMSELEVADDSFWLAYLELHGGQFQEAEKSLQKRLSMGDLFLPGAKNLGDTYMLIGYCFQKEKKYREAESFLRRGVAFREKFHPFDSDIIGSYGFLADCLQEQGKYAEEQEVLEHALAMEKIYPTSPYLDYDCFLLAECYQNQHKDNDAERLLAKALSLEQARQLQFSNIRDCLLRLAAVDERKGKLQEAEQLLRRALRSAEISNPDDTVKPETVLARIELINKKLAQVPVTSRPVLSRWR